MKAARHIGPSWGARVWFSLIQLLPHVAEGIEDQRVADWVTRGEEMLQLAVEKGVIKNTLRLLKYSVAINSKILECLFVLVKEEKVTETPICIYCFLPSPDDGSVNYAATARRNKAMAVRTPGGASPVVMRLVS